MHQFLYPAGTSFFERSGLRLHMAKEIVPNENKIIQDVSKNNQVTCTCATINDIAVQLFMRRRCLLVHCK